jgi:hypothetical protein
VTPVERVAVRATLRGIQEACGTRGSNQTADLIELDMRRALEELDAELAAARREPTGRRVELRSLRDFLA